MCLIVAKPKGKQMPNGKDLERWFKQYPHGFGIAFQHLGRVRLLKGAMTTREMFGLIAKMKRVLKGVPAKDVDVIMQFRFAITGSVCPAFCHPFPITPDQRELNSLDVTTDCALAHNGIIYEYNQTYNCPNTYEGWEDINDAQEFIKDYLVELGDSLWNPAVQRLIEAATVSKFALLSNKGITYIGDFIEDDGYWYSNGGYLPLKSSPVNKLPFLPEGKLSEGEVSCDSCFSSTALLYAFLEDGISDGSLLCYNCFKLFYKREPTEEERAI